MSLAADMGTGRAGYMFTRTCRLPTAGAIQAGRANSKMRWRRRHDAMNYNHGAVAQRRSRASGLTRPLAEAIRGFGLGFVAVSVPPFRCGFQ